MRMSKRSIYACIGSGHSRFHHALAREYCTKRKTISIMSEGSKYCAIVKSVKGLTELGKESSSASKSEKWVPTTYCIYCILKGGKKEKILEKIGSNGRIACMGAVLGTSLTKIKNKHS